jgi:hypothetical protein
MQFTNHPCPVPHRAVENLFQTNIIKDVFFDSYLICGYTSYVENIVIKIGDR